MKLKLTGGIQYQTLDSGLLQQEIKTIFIGLRSRPKIRELTTKTLKTSYLQLVLLKTTLNQLPVLIAMVTLSPLPQLLPALQAQARLRP